MTIPSIVAHIPKAQMEYLGDGVYAAYDGEGVTLWTERENGVNWMVMSRTKLLALKRFMFRMGNYTLQDTIPTGENNDEG